MRKDAYMTRATHPVDPQDLRRVGSAIRTFRAAKGWTQQQLADFAGVSLRTITNLEVGARAAHGLTYGAVARALRVDIEDLIGSEDAA